jgi:rhamnosyltransferase
MISGVIVTFYPNKNTMFNIKILAKQVDILIIIDNTPKKDKINLIDAFGDLKNVICEENQVNLGLSQALNRGIEIAKNNNAIWICFFDQDSQMPSNYIQCMIESFKASEKQFGRVGVMSPIYWNEKNQIMLSFGDSTRFIKPVLTTLTSGSLFSITIFHEVGNFCEELFIDYIDHEFCLRLNSLGYKVLQNPNLVLKHEIGNPIVKKFFFKKILASNHSSFRRYHQAKNRFILAKKYYKIYPFWLFRSFLGFFNEIVVVIFFEKNKLKKLKASGKGIIFGLKHIFSKEKE